MSTPHVILTENAVRRIKQYQADDASLAGKVLRVFVEGGGCAGFQYGIIFDDPADEDKIATYDGVEVAVDPRSALFLQGVQVDFHDQVQNHGFSITNPQASSTCGCGMSFNT